MRFSFFLIILIIVGFLGQAQDLLPVEYRVTKQSMSIPLTPIREAVFIHRYAEKPLNVKFDGSLLSMKYDDQKVFKHETVSKVDEYIENSNGKLLYEQYFYTLNSNTSDTISLVIDHEIPYIQLILPSKDSRGVKTGYKSYRIFSNLKELAIKQ